MKIAFRAKGIKLTQDLEEYASKKINKLEKLLPGVIEVWIELAEDNSMTTGKKYYAEAQIRIARGSFRATESSSEIHAAIDALVPKLKKEIERFKTRGDRAKHKRGIKGVRENVTE